MSLRKQITIFFIASLILHIGLLLLTIDLDNLWEKHRKQAGEEAKKYFTVKLIQAPAANAQSLPKIEPNASRQEAEQIPQPKPDLKKLDRKLVDLSSTPPQPERKDLEDKEAKYLSDRHMRVEKETVAPWSPNPKRETVTPPPGDPKGDDKSPEPVKKSVKETAGSNNQQGTPKPASPKNLVPQRSTNGFAITQDKAPEENSTKEQGQQANPNLSFTKNGTGQKKGDIFPSFQDLAKSETSRPGTIDLLNGVPVGEMTLLNVDSYKFASFFNRLREVGTFFWSKEIRALAYRSTPPTHDLLVLLHVAINADGSLNAVEVKESCGTPAIDRAAIATVQEMTPIYSIPKELLNQNNQLEGVWGFTLYVN